MKGIWKTILIIVIVNIIMLFIGWFLEPVKSSLVNWFYRTGLKVMGWTTLFLIIISVLFYLLKVYIQKKLDEEFIESLYLRFLMRGSDEKGFKNWFSRYRKYHRDRTSIIDDFKKGAEAEYREEGFNTRYLDLK